MIDICLTLKINTLLVLLTGAHLRTTLLAMSVVRSRKRVALGMLRRRTAPRNYSEMIGVWASINL
jgi:hypothetical protein